MDSPLSLVRSKDDKLVIKSGILSNFCNDLTRQRRVHNFIPSKGCGAAPWFKPPPTNPVQSARGRPLLERLRGVAFLAGAAKGATMRVVAAVAAETGRRCRDARGGFLSMTGMTRRSLVRACQGKLRALVMVEAPKRKTIRIMAARAGRSNPALVVFILVTTFAVTRCILVGRRAMAFLARNGGVKANQWKARKIVVEVYLFPPTGFSVAALAFVAELTFVRVLLLVA